MFNRVISTFVVACALSACGSSTKSDATSNADANGSAASADSAMYGAASAASVGVLMTDAPADLTTLAAVNVSIKSVQVHVVQKGAAGGGFDPNLPADGNATSTGDDRGQNQNSAFVTNGNDTSIDDDDNWQTLSLANTNFNLLALQGNVTAVVGGLDLPTGVLTQIRVFLDPNGINDVVLADSTVCTLDVSSVIDKGFKIDEDFPHTPLHDGNTTHFVIDFDLHNSLSQEAACAFSLHPVFHLRGHDVNPRHDGGWALAHPRPQDGNAQASAGASASAGNGNTTVSGSGSVSGSTSRPHQERVVKQAFKPFGAPNAL